MKLTTNLRISILTCLLAVCTLAGYAQQVTLTASSGTADGTFTTLKGAFDAINAGTHKGNIVIKINSSTTETASAALNASAALSTSSPYYTRIIIYPTTTGLSISGNLTTALINLNGADNVIIDGRKDTTGSTKSLSISNTSALSTTGTSTIQFINDATNNTVRYCTLKGSSTDAAAGIIFFSTTTGTTGNDNNTISNNNITNAANANRPLNAVYALGTSARNNDNNTISNNNFFDFLSTTIASQGISINSHNSAYIISDNSFYETASFAAAAAVNYNVILISAATGTGNGFTVSGNYIGGNAASCGGTAWTKTAQNNAFTAISVTTATGTANSIQGNTIQNINWTNAGTSGFTGISLSGATVANIGTTTGNTIGAAIGTGSITFTSTTTATNFFGISIGSTDVVVCKNNTIGSITAANAVTNATNFTGIIKTATAGTTTISDNTIGSTTTANSINASSASSTATNIQSVYGIQSAGTGTVTISGNTIANLVNATSNATTTAAGLVSGINVSAGTNTISGNTVRDLSCANANTSITGTASVTGIVVNNATAAAQTVTSNTVYNLSNSFNSFAGGVIGISYDGSTTASTVNRNFIHSLSVSGASSTTAKLYGIKINAGATTYSNNIISLGGNTKTDLFGIYQTGAASNNNSLFYNTVYISGSLLSGSTNLSYALYSTATTNTRDFRNNVLVNARSTTGGTNLHYALYIAASGGTLNCNYNNYFVSGTGGVLGYYGANKTALPIVTAVTGNDANSIITNPVFTGTGTTASDYTPTVSGTAVTGTGITNDYNGNIRGTFVSMGAIEVLQGPSAPAITSAAASVGSAIVSFTKPGTIGGGNITNYEYSTNNGANWTARNPVDTTSPLFISGLTNCTSYDIKIRAVNITGGGAASTSVVGKPRDGQLGGINWTTRTSAANNIWNSVTYGNGLFVAVSSDGTGNRVMTSPDGITWTVRTSAADNSWTSVTYGNGLFVAVALTGTGNRVMTSTDGITWTIRTSTADNTWYSVTYGNGLFVAVSNGGTNRVMTSSDGITWTARTAAVNSQWQSVTYGNGLFVAVAACCTGNRVMTSSDLLAPDQPAINSITPGATTADVAFTAPSSIGGSAITNYEYSTDGGSTWVTSSPASTTSPLSITGLSPTTNTVQTMVLPGPPEIRQILQAQWQSAD
ncbi:MAG: beta strand repeat-containing protein [Bacteroidota bacterium]